LAALGQKPEAEKVFREALEEDPKSRPVRFDFAKFLFEHDRPLDALKLANEMVAENGEDTQVWQFGGQVALSQPQLVEFAQAWTGEAVKFCPDESPILLQRAEALLLGQEIERALPLWAQAHSPKSAWHLAALVLCEVLSSETRRAFPPAVEKSVSQEFLKWYRHLIKFKARSVIQLINQKLEEFNEVLPTAALMLGAAMKRADAAMSDRGRAAAVSQPQAN
jgi:tetratricopeptide (TPR) repeat protein